MTQMGWSGEGKLNNPYWATWVRDSWANHDTYNLAKRYMRKPGERLYNTAKDPPASDIKSRLSTELDRWIKMQGDPGAPLDTPEAFKAARRGSHIYGPASGP
jgi:uncharacterized sulfatase